MVSTTANPESELALSAERIEAIESLHTLLRLRVELTPPPEQHETLAELVQAARRKLREDSGRIAADELIARKSVLTGVLRELRR
jgi:hypothetical protein